MDWKNWISIAIIVAVVGFAATASAQGDRRERAANHLDRGVKYQDLGEYAKAAEEYQKAYDLVPHPEMLYNLAQAHRLSGNDATALEFYERYLAIEPNGRGADAATRHRDALKSRASGSAGSQPAEPRQQGSVPSLRPQLVQTTTVQVSPKQSQNTDVNVVVGKRPGYEAKLKSAYAAFGLSLLIPGSGQFYYGDNKWGAIYLGTAVGWLGASTLIFGVESGEEWWISATIGAGIMGLISAIHATVGVGNYNSRIVDEYESARQSKGFQGIHYAPLTVGETTAHGMGASWRF